MLTESPTPRPAKGCWTACGNHAKRVHCDRRIHDFWGVSGMILAKTTIGPRHHGRKMSLKAFEFAQVEEGYLYELARGYIVVSEVPTFPHARRVAFIRTRLGHYHVEHP